MKRSYRNLGQAYGDWSDQLALDGIHHSLQSIVRPQLLVNVMKVVPEGAGAYVQRAGDVGRALAFRKKSQHLFLLL
jgi:hypothetical protein